MKKLISIIIVTVMMLSTALCSFAADKSFNFVIVDKFVSLETLEKLEFKAENIYKSYGFKAFFIMNSDVQSEGAYAYATEFYKKSIKKNGVVFCLERESGKAYIYSEDFTESECSEMIKAYSLVEGGTYGERINGYLSKAEETAKKYFDKENRVIGSERLKPRFMDFADVFETQTESAVYTDIDALSEKRKCDIVFVTYDEEISAEKYGESFYADYNFGYGKEKTGIILSLYVPGSKISIIAKGNAEKCFNTDYLKKSSEKLALLAKEKKYIDVFIEYLDIVDGGLSQTDSDITDVFGENEDSAELSFPPLPGNKGENGEIMTRIYDDAQVISSAVENEIKTVLDKVSGETGIDFAVAAVYSVPEGFSLSAYAEAYAAHFDFGLGGDNGSVLLLISFEPEGCFLTATGKAKKYFGKNDLRKYTQAFYSQYRQQNYEEAAKIFAYEAGERFLKEKLEMPLILLVVFSGIAVVAVAVAVISIKKKKK